MPPTNVVRMTVVISPLLLWLHVLPAALLFLFADVVNPSFVVIVAGGVTFLSDCVGNMFGVVEI